jgi:ribonuclease P protein component
MEPVEVSGSSKPIIYRNVDRNIPSGVLLKTFHFKKSARILKRNEFVHLSKHGQKLKNEHFIIAVGPGRSTTRLGITVTKKIGNAATRNRIKRLAREYFRLNRHRVQGSWDINIIARQKAASISSAATCLSLGKLFDRLNKGIEN